MINYSDAAFKFVSIHHVGNKQKDEYFSLSKKPIEFQEESVLPDLLLQYFLKPFNKVQEAYQFYHPNGELQLNEIWYFVNQYFEGSLEFHPFTEQIAKHLYEVTQHPNIKAGELYVAKLENVTYQGEDYDALGIFKSENKETYLKVYPDGDEFSIDYEQEAININKLDKGVLILNSRREDGCIVLVVDQTNQQDTVYWKDDFLQIKRINDTYQQTGNLMKVYKKFVVEEIDQHFEMEAADKIDLLNRSMDYFKNNETFDQEQFSHEVIGNEQASSLFVGYKKNFEEEFDTPISDAFEIASPAVKKMQSTYKSVLKLDKNFHVYIHGKREYIEKGYDEEKGLNYYKLYFENEVS